MELVAELWEANIKVRNRLFCCACSINFALCSPVIYEYQAEFVPVPDPSLTEQYEYASEHDIRCLVLITDAGLSQKGFVKVSLITTHF